MESRSKFVRTDKMIYCTCPRCNMKKPTPEEDPYDEAQDLEGCHI